MKLAKAISKRLKGLRETSGLSQQEVANRADLSLSLVAKLEQGKKADPRASTLLALAGALDIKPGELLDNLFPPEPEKAPGEEHAGQNGATQHDQGGPEGGEEQPAKRAKAKKKDKAKKKVKR